MTGTNNAAGKLPFARTRWAIVGFVAGVFTWSFAGGKHPGPVADKTVGEVVDGAPIADESTLNKVYREIENTTSNVRNRISDVQNSAHNMSLANTVKSRLSQKKSIDDDRIEVEVKEDGTVVLKGQVPDAGDKEMACEIARGTKGVLRVEDRLSVPPTTRVFAVKPEGDEQSPGARRTR
jgi:hypothetical protein